MILGMGIIGWLVAIAIGFAVGGIMFLSMKAQVEYVVEKRGPDWLLPAMLYARMALVAAVLFALAALVPREKLAGAMLGGLMGLLPARIIVGRMVKGGRPAEAPGEAKENADDA
jgi:hypothetical protein